MMLYLISDRETENMKNLAYEKACDKINYFNQFIS